MVDLGTEQGSNVETVVARPAFVLPAGGGGIRGAITFFAQRIRVDELAAVLIDIAINGNKEHFVENPELVKRGQELLKSRAKA